MKRITIILALFYSAFFSNAQNQPFYPREGYPFYGNENLSQENLLGNVVQVQYESCSFRYVFDEPQICDKKVTQLDMYDDAGRMTLTAIVTKDWLGRGSRIEYRYYRYGSNASLPDSLEIREALTEEDSIRNTGTIAELFDMMSEPSVLFFDYDNKRRIESIHDRNYIWLFKYSESGYIVNKYTYPEGYGNNNTVLKCARTEDGYLVIVKTERKELNTFFTTYSTIGKKLSAGRWSDICSDDDGATPLEFYKYNKKGDLTHIINSKYADPWHTVKSFEYTYDEKGNWISRKEYKQYDGHDKRLESWTTRTIHYGEVDSVGQFLLNRITAIDTLSFSQIMLQRAKLLAEKHDIDRALTLYEKAIEADPENWEVYYDLGHTLKENSNYNRNEGIRGKVETTLLRALELSPDEKKESIKKELCNYHCDLASYYSSSDKRKAVQEYEKALEYDQNEMIYYKLGELYMSECRYDSALSVLNQIDLIGNSSDKNEYRRLAEYYYEIAKHKAEAGNEAEAIEAFRKAYSINSGLVGRYGRYQEGLMELSKSQFRVGKYKESAELALMVYDQISDDVRYLSLSDEKAKHGAWTILYNVKAQLMKEDTTVAQSITDAIEKQKRWLLDKKEEERVLEEMKLKSMLDSTIIPLSPEVEEKLMKSYDNAIRFLGDVIYLAKGFAPWLEEKITYPESRDYPILFSLLEANHLLEIGIPIGMSGAGAFTRSHFSVNEVSPSYHHLLCKEITPDLVNDDLVKEMRLFSRLVKEQVSTLMQKATSFAKNKSTNEIVFQINVYFYDGRVKVVIPE